MKNACVIRWKSPADQREEPERRHREPHRGRALGDVVLRPGEADVGVLLLAGRGVAVLPVGELPAHELLGLGRLLAEERAEQHPAGVERGEQRADVAEHAQHRVQPAAVQRERTDPERHERERHRAPEAAHAVHVLLAAHRADH